MDLCYDLYTHYSVSSAGPAAPFTFSLLTSTKTTRKIANNKVYLDFQISYASFKQIVDYFLFEIKGELH